MFDQIGRVGLWVAVLGAAVSLQAEAAAKAPTMLEIAPVAQSGQTLCYDVAGNPIDCSGTGQDAEDPQGVAWPDPRFIIQSDGTVTDRLTGLIWLRDADCLGNFPVGRNWTDALAQIANLNTGTDFSCTDYTPGNFADWRLPNQVELLSLVSLGFDKPAIPDTAGTGQWSQDDPFTDVIPAFYWSSTPGAAASAGAWGAALPSGGSFGRLKTEMGWVWAVRGESTSTFAPVAQTGQTLCSDLTGAIIDCSGTGQDGDLLKGIAWPDPRFTDNGDGTVTDNLTLLTWLKDASCMSNVGAGRVWTDALMQVENLNLGTDFGCTDYAAGTFQDWRLPNHREQLSLSHLGEHSPALASHPFVGLLLSSYWSSTTATVAPDNAWEWETAIGGSLGVLKTDSGIPPTTHSVWPVRGGAPAFFEDGFESGDTSAWSSTVP